MLIRFYKGAGPGEVLLVFLTAVLVWTAAFVVPRTPSSFYYDTNPMPLYALLKHIMGDNALYGAILSFVLVMIMSFLIVNFNTSQFFINERTFLPGAIYVLLTGVFPDHQVLNPVLPASIFLIIAIRRIMDGYKNTGTVINFFDASLLIGTGTLFYANLIWYALLVIIGIVILHMGNIRELIISIIGLITPFLFTTGIYYAIGKDISSLPGDFYNNLFSASGKYYYSGQTISGLILLGVIILISLVHLFSVISNKKIKSRKTFTELIWALAISIVIYFALPSSSVEIIWLAGIPTSYIVAHYLIFSRKKLVPGILFAIFFIMVAVVQVWYLK